MIFPILVQANLAVVTGGRRTPRSTSGRIGVWVVVLVDLFLSFGCKLRDYCALRDASSRLKYSTTLQHHYESISVTLVKYLSDVLQSFGVTMRG